MREEPEEVGKRAGVEDGTDAVVEAAGEATQDGSGLDEEVGFVIGYGFSLGGEDIGDGRDQAELDEGKLLGAVADDPVLELPESLELDFTVRRGEPAMEVRVAAGSGTGGRRGRRRRRR